MGEEWPLKPTAGQHLERIAELYARVNIPCDAEFFACDYQTKCGLLRCRARNPVAREHLRRRNHADPPNFLSPQSQVIEDALLEFQKAVSLSDKYRRGGGFHLAAVLLAQEFRNWVDSFLAKLVSAEETDLAEVQRRLELIFELEDNELGMDEFARWQEAMITVATVLHEVQRMWPLFSAQEGIQLSLRQTETLLRMLFYNLVMYAFHVMRGDNCGNSFSPLTFNNFPGTPEVQRLHGTLSGRIMSMLLQDPVVMERHSANGGPKLMQDAVTSTVESFGFPLLDKLDGQRKLGAALGIEWDLAFLLLHDENGESGLVSTSASGLLVSEEEGDFGHRPSGTSDGAGYGTYEEALQVWLRMHSWAAGIARSEKLIGIAHKMSSLGGDLLLAEYANKERTHQILAVVAKGLAIVHGDCEALERMLRRGINAMLKKHGTTWFGNPAFQRWHVNYQRAQEFRKDILHCVSSAQSIIVRMQAHLQGLNTEAVRKEMSAKGRELVEHLKDACEAFNEPHGLEEHLKEQQSGRHFISRTGMRRATPEDGAHLRSLPQFVDALSSMKAVVASNADWGDQLWRQCQERSRDPFLGRAFRLRFATVQAARFLDVLESRAEGDEDEACASTCMSEEGAWWLPERGGSMGTYRLRLVGPPGSKYVGRYLAASIDGVTDLRGGGGEAAPVVAVERRGADGDCSRADRGRGGAAEWLLAGQPPVAEGKAAQRERRTDQQAFQEDKGTAPASRRSAMLKGTWLRGLVCCGGEAQAAQAQRSSRRKVSAREALLAHQPPPLQQQKKIADEPADQGGHYGPLCVSLSASADCSFAGGYLVAGKTRRRDRVKQALHGERDKHALFGSCAYVKAPARDQRQDGFGMTPVWTLEMVVQYA
eukprot:TRINITY_DN19567_c0_g3_i1.p1 TRINITY_DN19567_c0_g3~~TRINITY_DN19567_c0_g3_i1.p1  ORF type:complete len:898 (+),score=190.76 TRINITY_DN19567_c0_g3_i1:59-2695(+)